MFQRHHRYFADEVGETFSFKNFPPLILITTVGVVRISSARVLSDTYTIINPPQKKNAASTIKTNPVEM